MAPQLDPAEFAGYQAHAEVNGVVVVLVEARGQGLDPEFGGGRWALIDDHGSLLQHTNKRAARYFMRHPELWCEDCQALLPQPPRKD